MHKKGFTLVELSIVLVIIGIIASGVLVAQSMISTATSQTVLRTITQYDIAVTSFKTQYNGWPGEQFGVGDDDGNIYDSDKTLTHFDYEIANFWPQLQISGFDASGPKFSSAVGTYITNTGDNRNIPKLSYGVNTGVVVAYASPGKNAYYLADYSQSQPSFVNVKDTLTPAEGQVIDTKLDDGNPNTGNVIAATETIPNICTISPGGVYSYNLATTQVRCILTIMALRDQI